MQTGLVHRICAPMLIATLSLFAAASVAFGACQWTAPNFDVNTTNVRWKVTTTNKETCGQIFRSWGKMKVGNLSVGVRPRHGVAGIRNSVSDPGFAYKPAPGFVGDDAFQLLLDAYNGFVDATHKITVDVDVVVTP